MADLGGGEAGVQRARLRIVESAGQQAQPFGGAALDHGEYEQAIEQSLGLALANVVAKRDGIIVPEVVGGGLSATLHQLRDLDDVASLVVGESRHRGHEIGALGITADQRQRRLSGLAFAMEVVGVDRIEVGERGREPSRIGRDKRQRVTKRRDRSFRPRNDATFDRAT